MIYLLDHKAWCCIPIDVGRDRRLRYDHPNPDPCIRVGSRFDSQLVIVLSLMILTYIAINIVKISLKNWSGILSAITAAMALYLMWETRFW